MKNKKAISDLIGWVLLIGFTITIAAFVTTWVIDQTNKFKPEDVAGGLKVYCEDVVLSIEEISVTPRSNDCGENKVNTLLTLTLKNKGKFTVYDIKGLGVEDINYNFKSDDSDGLIPGVVSSDVTISFCKAETNNEIEIVPKIKVEGKEGYCTDNTLIINDDILNNAQLG